MKISRNWLQTYFKDPLPPAAELSDALTFHAFEIESVEERGGDQILDVKVTPNRGHDCLSHRGIAKELSAILMRPILSDPLRQTVSLDPKTDAARVRIEDPHLCPRFTGVLIRGITAGPSPAWLSERLEAIGQRSINTIVDITNLVMFDIGQPLHAFDAGKLQQRDGMIALNIRRAKAGEKMMGLDEKEYTLSSSMLTIEDANAGTVASIAGIKGGKPTGIDANTTDIFIEGANWNDVTIRKASQALKLRTDASTRFEQSISPEITAYGVSAAAKLVTELCGGAVVGYVDAYPVVPAKREVSVTTAFVNASLGTQLQNADIEAALTRLDLSHTQAGEQFTVHVPFERLDLEIPEDLVEEVARIAGYDKIPATELQPLARTPESSADFSAAESVREDLMQKGYSEVFTSVFAEQGERAVLNKVGGGRPYLRATLLDGMKDAYERNLRMKDALGLDELKLFEIGSVWSADKETIMVAIADKSGIKETPLMPQSAPSGELPTSMTQRYRAFSRYPYIVRDIAMWVPNDTDEASVAELIQKEAGKLAVAVRRFDRFEKGGRVSLAFRIIFQSFERTLNEAEANAAMEQVIKALAARGFEIR